MKKKNIAAVLLASAVLLQGCGSAVPEEGGYPEEEIQENDETGKEIFDPSSIRPQDDFNGYVNAKDLMEADITEHHGSTGSFEEVSDMVDDQINAIIDEIVAGDRDSYAPGSNEQLIYDVYYQVLDASTGGASMNEEDIADMLSNVEKVQNTTTMEEFLAVSGDLYRDWGVNPIFGVDINTDMHNSSAGSVWIQPFSSPTGQDLQDICIGGQWGQTVATCFRSILNTLGTEGEEAKERGVADAKLVIEIALGTDLDLVEQIGKDWGIAMQKALYRTNAEIDTLCPNVGFRGILSTLGLSEDQVEGAYLWDEGQLAKIDSLLTEEHLEEWKDITILTYLNTIADMLPMEYKGDPVLYSNDLYARDGVKMLLGKELGEEYVERYFDPATAEAVTEIAQDITDEYIVMIDNCEWMSDAGKTAITEKLDNMLYFIGADEPHEIDPKDADLIGHSVYDTRYRFNIRDYEERVEMIDEGVERNGFANMAPQTVNACYSPDMNVINITAAIMNPPFYSPEQSYWENLGGIGAVVGHEISHAFDNHGMMFDKNGNFNPEWIPEEDRKAFDEMAEKIEEYYSSQVVLDIHPVDGELTLGENLADISGVDCILRLTQNDGQRKELLENYARIWAGVTPKDNALRQLYMDVHSPGIVRVNAVVALFDPFYEIYDVKEGDAMYVAPEDRVTRW